ncbi:cell division protein ZapE [Francisella sp. SYW-2]|uniref:cell division protein ZapE n=1 Tax=Francisella sp. SYW-2 TaxID=2610886 RepID=UPI00123DCE30|nr:cell division protein ZapE [Francisella sp. SYW-2]
MKLENAYLQKVRELNLKVDSLQLEAIKNLQEIMNQISVDKKKKFGFLKRSLYSHIKGLYMWGGVGRGKTFIMDIFFDNLPIKQKRRQHFSHFMKEIHSELRKYQGYKNPISKVAYDMAKDMRIICFDEFFVEDIADAMILGSVFTELFKLGVILVATSNIEPENLYKRGLQRELFLPAIDILIKNVNVLNLDSGVDYRFRLPTEYLNYLYPYNEQNRKNFFDKFFLRNEHFDKDLSIDVLGRRIAALLISHKDICFDFKVICGDGRSSYDYIDICSKYEQVFIYNLTGFDQYNEDMARRFIALIDEFYDQNKKVVILANNDFTQLYKGERLRFEFQRTISRLNDMQNNNFGISNE